MNDLRNSPVMGDRLSSTSAVDGMKEVSAYLTFWPADDFPPLGTVLFVVILNNV